MQWNSRGLLRKLSEFKQFLSNKFPSAICLTETHLRPSQKLNLPGYHVYRRDRHDGFGGLAVLVPANVNHRPVPLVAFADGVLETLAVDVNIDSAWSRILLVYNPCKNVSLPEFSHYFAQLGSQGVVCGDFNAHHEHWEPGKNCRNPTGIALFDFLTSSNLFLLLNPPNLPTRVDPASGSTSNLDLFVATRYFHSFSISLAPDLGSDHLPVLLSSSTRTCPRLSFRPRWNFHNVPAAMWDAWAADLAASTIDRAETATKAYSSFETAVLCTAKKYFPLRSSSTPRRPGNPWWNAACELAVNNRRKAIHLFSRFPTPANKTALNKFPAIAVNTLLTEKKASWNDFLARITHRTPSAQIWKMFRSVSGRAPPSSFPLSSGTSPLSSTETANALAEHFSLASSHEHLLAEPDSSFLTDKLISDDDDTLNHRFSLSELRSVLSNLTSRSSPGSDLLHNQFLSHLPCTHHHALLNIFNLSFRTADIPPTWKSSLIVPIPKSGKDLTTVSAYRPISLLSCVGKLMERLVVARLAWYLERNNTFLPHQFGFRPKSGTMDALILFEHDIHLALRTKQIVLAVFFDLSGAFDRASHQAILFKLASHGVSGRLLRWVSSFLTDRSFSVSVSSASSQSYPIISGVPQGAIISPLLFNILLSDLPSFPGVTTSIYADDITMFVTADSASSAQALLQAAVDNFALWAHQWGLLINAQKSATSFFTLKRSVPTCPSLHISGVPIPYSQHHKLLGIIFDSPRLTWRPYIEFLRLRCQERLNIMRVLAGSRFGGSRPKLLLFYLAYIRGLTDYGLPLYSSASPSLLARLDVIHSTATRLLIGTWRSTSLPSLYCEAGLLPPDLYREERCGRLLLQLLFRPADHPFHALIRRDRFLTSIPFSCRHHRSPLLYRACRLFHFHSFTLPPSSPQEIFSVLPPWFPFLSIIHTSFPTATIGAVEGSAPALFADLCSTSYPDFLSIYTDGSVMGDNATCVGVGVVVPHGNLKFPFRLLPGHTILAAELFGILQALIFLSSHQATTPAVIFTDSLSSLFLLSSSRLSSYSPLILAIHRHLSLFPLKSVHLQWIPAHCAIPGNEAADAVAKEAATSSLPIHELPFSLPELQSKFSSSVWSYWQVRWTAIRGQHSLGTHKPLVHPWAWQGTQSRFFESLFARFRLGTAPLNKSLYKIHQIEAPECHHCHSEETVYHFFFVCPHYLAARRCLLLSLRAQGHLAPNLSLLLSGQPGDPVATLLIFKLVEAYINSTHRFDQP